VSQLCPTGLAVFRTVDVTTAYCGYVCRGFVNTPCKGFHSLGEYL
jgi:hypothetical protein